MFIHPLSDIHKNAFIGDGTRVWQFVVIMDDVKIGVDCNLCAHTLIESGVVVGNRVTIKSGVFLWSGIILEDDVFVGPNATFTNDRFPRSKNVIEQYEKIFVRKGASIGANATILPGVEIGENALVGAGSVVTKHVPERAVVVGNPAKIVRMLEM